MDLNDLLGATNFYSAGFWGAANQNGQSERHDQNDQAHKIGIYMPVEQTVEIEQVFHQLPREMDLQDTPVLALIFREGGQGIGQVNGRIEIRKCAFNTKNQPT